MADMQLPHTDWADYLRDEAAKYRQLAETAEDLSIKLNIEDRMPGG